MDSAGELFKSAFSWSTYVGMYDLGKALYNREISLSTIVIQSAKSAVAPAQYVTMNSVRVFGGKPTDRQVRTYGENLGEVLMSIGGSGAAIKTIAKVAPKLAKTLKKLGSKSKEKSKGCNCFTAGTKVQTDEGEKNIEDIEVGDKVLAKDENNPDGELAYKEVTNLYRNQRDDIIKLHVGEQIIETTDNHPFWVEGKGWVFADELQVGDKLQKADGSNLTIDKVEFVKLDEKVTVYNFTVADYHTYYVTDIGIWVHNTECGWTPHGYKHIANKNMSWNDVVKSTKSGPAKYLHGTNVEAFERNVWKNGLDVTNGKTWKVMKFDKVIGASEGVETRYVRVEYSGGTIHGHPITVAEYKKLLK